MSFSWRVEPALGDPEVDELGTGGPFADQQAAEVWLVSNYLELDALGVRKVSLYEEDRLVYGPMSLES